VAKVIADPPDAPGSASHGSFPGSQAVVAAGIVFVAGQGPFDGRTGASAGESIQGQARRP
jgi:enamine deaminase RidA (YjgF/YER057c/UK114 family)